MRGGSRIGTATGKKRCCRRWKKAWTEQVEKSLDRGLKFPRSSVILIKLILAGGRRSVVGS